MTDKNLRNHPTVRDASVRARDFEEVSLGFDAETARAEAERCLSCKNAPCAKGCPVGVDIPRFISLFKNGDTDGAKAAILKDSSFPSVCGRVLSCSIFLRNSTLDSPGLRHCDSGPCKSFHHQ